MLTEKVMDIVFTISFSFNPPTAETNNDISTVVGGPVRRKNLYELLLLFSVTIFGIFVIFLASCLKFDLKIYLSDLNVYITLTIFSINSTNVQVSD